MRLTSQLSVFKQAQARRNAAKKTWATAAEPMNDLMLAHVSLLACLPADNQISVVIEPGTSIIQC